MACAILMLPACRSTREPPAIPSAFLPPAEEMDFSGDYSSIVEPQPGPDTQPYRLGIGDVIDITVYGEPNSTRRIPIDPTGNITYMLVGSIPAAGRTLTELQQDLQARIDKEFSYMIVGVVPVRFASRTYTILGQVEEPGTYALTGKTTLLMAICRAGGFREGQFRNSTIDMHDLRHSTVVREGNVLPVDFRALVLKGDMSQNILLSDGDIINIPSALEQQVYILGAVRFPRSIGFFSSVTLLQAIAEARGLDENAGGRIVIVRGSLVKPEVLTVYLPDVLSGKSPNIQLAPKDIVYVPERGFGFLREIVKTAIDKFAITLAGESASQLYKEVTPSAARESRPIVIQ